MFRKRGKRQRVFIPEPNHVDLIKELGQDKLPCLVFTFSRRDCQVKARELARKNLFKRDGKILEFLNQKLVNSN